ncbi:MAG: DUF4968 domain-containing protein [Bacteroidales bacterium]|nr:DUF4968 domain-containing protein [Bacteroidales bacterium]
MSEDFRSFENTYYLADSISSFNMKTGRGKLTYSRHEYNTRMAFNNMLGVLEPVEQNEFPAREYEGSPTLSFSIDFVSPRTVRIRAKSGFETQSDDRSLMLVNGEAPDGDIWDYRKTEEGYRYTSKYGTVTITKSPWHIEFRDAKGNLLTKTVHLSDLQKTFTPVLPFSYVRRASDYSRSFNAAFSLSPGERIYGCGESFTELNKRGEKVVLWADDANGTQNESMYKPVPFFMSNKGYGMFMHTSSPITCDFGKYFNGVNSMMIGDSKLDLFVFLGEPKQILDEYTDLTGKADMPPLWSFGFWMSRITYVSEEEGRTVADKLRKNKIPADVIHFDTGWFGTDWRCDYRFAEDRFDDPEGMLSDLKDQGFHVSLWQLPYFTPNNRLFPEIIDKGFYVKNRKGNLPYEDAVLDFSNPKTVEWYQDKIARLLEMGVGAIKVDFGEAAPYKGIYHSGRTGFYEHNLYPLRYNKAATDITKEVTGESIIWARSTWAGSQRYPVHWGGDAANSNTGMASTLRGGLSLGLSGFSFWAHDLGGFVQKAPEDLYRRWTPFGMLTSHTRSHGAPPTEPWAYGEDFMNEFRKADEMRYKLMPYIYAQARHCTKTGLPMVRTLFVEYPNDPGSWRVDDQYMFGSDMLVAPLFESRESRDVYLPPGEWIDYQTGKSYESGWHHINAGDLPIVVLIKEGSVIPHIKLAQSTMNMDWSKLDLVVYSDDKEKTTGKVCLPENNVLHKVTLQKEDGKYELTEDPFPRKVHWNIKSYRDRR